VTSSVLPVRVRLADVQNSGPVGIIFSVGTLTYRPVSKYGCRIHSKAVFGVVASFSELGYG